MEEKKKIMEGKKLEFNLEMFGTKKITIIVKDEDLFKEKCKEWNRYENQLRFFDLEESFFENCIELIHGDIDWIYEDDESFYDVLSDNDFLI
jgi:hypothetical protein